MNRNWLNKSFLSLLIGFGLLFSTTGASAAVSVSGSVFDMPLDKAYANDFFQFFRFRVVAVSVTDDGYMEIIFKPPKREPSRASVKLHVVLKKDGEIKRMQLVLGREFINDSKQGMFARDVAKSFIQAGVHKEDYAQARPVVNEIFFRQKLTPIILAKGKSKSTISIFKLGEGKLASGDIIIIGDGGSIPKLPAEYSDIYKCFTGIIPAYEMKMSKSTLSLLNTKVEGHKVLLITISPLGEPVKAEGDALNFHTLPLYVP